MMETMDTQTPVTPSLKKQQLQKPKLVLLVKLWTELKITFFYESWVMLGKTYSERKLVQNFFLRNLGAQSPVHLFSVDTMLRHVSQTVPKPALKCDLGHRWCVPGHKLQVWIKHAQTRKWAAVFPFQPLRYTVDVETERTARLMYKVKRIRHGNRVDCP